MACPPMTGRVQTDNRPDGKDGLRWRPCVRAAARLGPIIQTSQSSMCSPWEVVGGCWSIVAQAVASWPMDGLPEGTASAARPAARPYTCIATPGLFPVGRSCFGDGRCELVSGLDKQGIGKGGASGSKGKSLSEMRRRRGEGGMRGRAGQGRAGHSGAPPL